MNILLLGNHHGRATMWVPGKSVLSAAVLAAGLVVGGAGWAGYELALHRASGSEALERSQLVQRWQARISEAQADVAAVKERSQQEIDALTRRLGELQARAMRVDALGQNLVAAADMKNHEFNFATQPALGGPEPEGAGETQDLNGLENQIRSLQTRLRSREKQLALMDILIVNRELNSQREVDGRPVTWGWTSSEYGYRNDPFTGRRSWHTGMDFAGRDGGAVVAVAAGVVTKAREKGGYGYLVEIDHGDGLQTRYAHAKELLVETGEVVEKGQQIAIMGSTGRSTGPHVHFEVVKDGTRQNPKDFL